jgi:hypothetical protein
MVPDIMGPCMYIGRPEWILSIVNQPFDHVPVVFCWKPGMCVGNNLPVTAELSFLQMLYFKNKTAWFGQIWLK